MNCISRFGFGLIGSLVTTLAMSAPYAYVPNEKSGTVSVINTETDQVIQEIKVGSKPRGLAISKYGKTLYVSDQPSHKLFKVDLDKLAITRHVRSVSW